MPPSPPHMSMPAYPPARKFPPSPPEPAYVLGDDGPRETAYVIFVRHGERGLDKSDNGLTDDGKARAMYLDKCIAKSPSIAFPLGHPTRLLASTRGPSGSHRPYDTLAPIARRFNVSIELADMMEIYSALEAVPTLKPGDTMLVAWQHWFMPRMIAALDPPTPVLINKFPPACPSEEWVEPEYAKEEDGTGDCYGVIWQLALSRPLGDENAPWQSVSFAQMHEGFSGKADGPCAAAMSPIAPHWPY